MAIEDFSNEEFAAYLERVAADFEESGYECTPADYREAARRIRDIEHREEAAYQAGMVDAVASHR